MNQNANISVRIGRGSVCHPARILDGVKVMACGCPNSANGHGANAMTTVAFGWSAVTCKRGEAHRQSAEDQAITDLSLIHISEPTRPRFGSRMPSSA